MLNISKFEAVGKRVFIKGSYYFNGKSISFYMFLKYDTSKHDWVIETWNISDSSLPPNELLLLVRADTNVEYELANEGFKHFVSSSGE